MGKGLGRKAQCNHQSPARGPSPRRPTRQDSEGGAPPPRPEPESPLRTRPSSRRWRKESSTPDSPPAPSSRPCHARAPKQPSEGSGRTDSSHSGRVREHPAGGRAGFWALGGVRAWDIRRHAGASHLARRLLNPGSAVPPITKTPRVQAWGRAIPWGVEEGLTIVSPFGHS